MDRHVLAKESIRASILTYIGAGLGFFTTFFILTQYLEPEQIGLIRLIQELAVLISSFALIGLSTSINRFFPYFRSTNQKDQVVHNGFWYYLIKMTCIGTASTLLLLALTYILFRANIEEFILTQNLLFQHYYYLIIPLSIIIVFWTISELYSIQLYKLAIPKGIRELGLRVFLLISYLIFTFTTLKFDGLMYLFIGSFALCLILSITYLKSLVPLNMKHRKEFISPKLKHDFKRYTLLAIISTVGTTLASRMDLFMVSFIQTDGLQEAGIFTIAFFMVSILEIPTRSLIGITTPRIAQYMKEQDFDGINQIYKKISFYQLLTSLIIGFIIWFNFDNILEIMPNGISYQRAKNIFLLLGIAKLIEVTFTACHPIINCSHYYHWNIYYTVWLCIIAFIANLYFIPIWGTIGAAFSTLITAFIGYGLLQSLLYCKFKLQPISKRLILLIPLLLLLISFYYLMPHLENPILDCCLSSVFIMTLVLAYLYLSQACPELFSFIKTKYLWIKRRFSL